MVNRGDNVWVVYPEYLDAAYSHKEGRKVPRKFALQNPKREEIVEAARELDLFLYEENASHPGHCWQKRGRVIIRKEKAKLFSLKVLALTIRKTRQEKNKAK